jgi:hypothetical protein
VRFISLPFYLQNRVLIKSHPYPIRTNAICPWMTETRMVTGIDADWAAAGLPRNKASDVANVIAGVLVSSSLNGEALYVEGGRAWGIEEGIDETQPLWMGEKQSKDFLRGQEVLGTGENWWWRRVEIEAKEKRGDDGGEWDWTATFTHELQRRMLLHTNNMRTQIRTLLLSPLDVPSQKLTTNDSKLSKTETTA